VPRLVRHAMPVGQEARDEGPLFLVGELWRLLTFTFEVLQRAG
jgi:hypothetical protein